MAAKRQIDDFTRSVLERGTIEGNVLKLPGQLDRADYLKVDKVLKGLGGKWDRKAGGHVFPFDPAELIDKAANEGAYVDRKQELQFFETPDALASDMVMRAGIKPGDKVLEPSAGHGAIVAPLLAAGATVTAIDIDYQNLKALKKRTGLEGLHIDFLTWATPTDEFAATMGLQFDAVVMNPPFRNNQDIRHIRAAWAMLKPGGRLVAVASPHFTFASERECTDFREWLEHIGAEVMEIEAGAFKESGTAIGTRLIVATKKEA